MRRSVLLVCALAAVIMIAAGCRAVRPTPPPPKAMSPANGSSVNTVTPTLAVTSIKDADQYQWTLKDQTGKTVITKGTSTGPSWVVPKGTLVNETKYLWTASAHNTHGWGKDFAPEWSFETEVAIPTAPMAVAPSDGGEVSTLTPMLSVNPVIDADQYQFSVKDTTGKEVAKGTGTDASWMVPGGMLADKMKYSWTAQVQNAAGWGPYFAPEWTFRVKLPPPPKPPAPPLATIHFDFDKYNIRPGDATILEGNATWLRANMSTSIVLAGYCDPIGTEEYNRGLGLRRANSARSYLVKLGIDGSRLSVISYGKENLVTTDETKYELNRRVEFKSK